MRPVKRPLRGTVSPIENASDAAQCALPKTPPWHDAYDGDDTVRTAVNGGVPQEPMHDCIFIYTCEYLCCPPENEILLSAALPGDENGKTRLPNLQLPLRHSEPAGAYHVYPRHMEHFTRARPLPREVQRVKGRESEPFPASAGGRVSSLYNNIDGFPRRRDTPALASVCNRAMPKLHFRYRAVILCPRHLRIFPSRRHRIGDVLRPSFCIASA